ncbi:MAG: 50S ribosomal protein L21 [Candidatus Marinimicrobia bacterium]|nr:50S ribosomal protein L21 [Candidatus Neomarinimicrobiota bacterium]
MERKTYAIAEIAGKQVILEQNKDLTVPKLDLEPGNKLIIDKILYYKNDETIEIGTPYIEGMKFEAIVKEHFRDNKVIVFKKKRRKGYKVKKGHRQEYTIIHIDKLESSPITKKQTTKQKVQTSKVKDSKEETSNGT